MKKHQTVQKATGGQIKELASALVEAIPSNITIDDAQYWIGKKGKLAKEVRKIFADKNQYADLIQDWQDFYYDVFGIKADFSNLVIPEKRKGFDRLIVVAQGVTPQYLYDKCDGLFKVWKWTDKNLDEIVVSDRTAKNGAYAIWVRDRVEADEELRNLSANQLKKQGMPGITLEERLIYELKYFKETGKHLDIKNWTLCLGSRYSDGFVPSAFWSGDCGEMSVGGCHSGDAGGGYGRAREAVS